MTRKPSEDGLLMQEGDDVGERIHVCVGAECNNNCIFCMEEDRAERAAMVGRWSQEDVKKVIRDNADRNEILFTSGEPTTNRHLIDYVREAAAAGYNVVGVITNGRLFSYPPFAVRLLRAGLNNIIVSIHGPDAASHDALTRTKGSFEQTLAGLKTLSSLKSAFGFKLQTSTVVTSRNLDRMKDFCDLVAGLSIDAHAFNVMMPDGGGKTHLTRLMPRYRDVASVFATMFDQIDPVVAARMALVDIPYCVTTALPDSVRGYVERYFHFEPDGAFEAKARAAGVTRTSDVESPEQMFVPGAMDGENETFSKVTRTWQEAWVKTKRPECSKCRYNKICRGVWKAYLDHFGWEEFEPVIR